MFARSSRSADGRIRFSTDLDTCYLQIRSFGTDLNVANTDHEILNYTLGDYPSAFGGTGFNWPKYNLAISRQLNLQLADVESGLLPPIR